MVGVCAEQTEAAPTEAILDGCASLDLATRRAEYETESRSKYDVSAALDTAEQVTAERKQQVVSV